MRNTTLVFIASLFSTSLPSASALAQPEIDTSTVPCDKPGTDYGNSTRNGGSGSPCSFGSGSKVPPEIPAEQAPATRSDRAVPDSNLPELKGLPGTSGTGTSEPIN